MQCRSPHENRPLLQRRKACWRRSVRPLKVFLPKRHAWGGKNDCSPQALALFKRVRQPAVNPPTLGAMEKNCGTTPLGRRFCRGRPFFLWCVSPGKRVGSGDLRSSPLIGATGAANYAPEHVPRISTDELFPTRRPGAL